MTSLLLLASSDTRALASSLNRKAATADDTRVNGSALAWALDQKFAAVDDGYNISATQWGNASNVQVETFYDQVINHSDFKMRDEMFRYSTPAVIVLGNLSNLLALFVLRRKKLRRNSVCIYLFAYAIANLLVLNFMLGVAWVCFAFNKRYVTNLADWSCRLWSFVTNVVTYSGIWFIVAMNIDRLIYTTSRSTGHSHCTDFSAKAVVVAIMTGLIVVSIHAMWTFELQPHGCYVPFDLEDFHIIIWPWWSATLYTYLPLFMILSLNIAHAIALCVQYVRSSQPSPASADMKDSYVASVMVLSITFFLLAVPATVTNILDIRMPSSWLSVNVVARMELTKKITELLSSLNQVLFGLLLIVSSREFRHEFMALLRVVFCCIASRRKFKVFEMRQTSNSEDSSPHRQVDYQLCNNHEETITSV